MIVIVPPWTSSGRSFFVRAFSASSAIARAIPRRLRSWALRITGTMRPLPSSSETAIPTCTWERVTIFSPRISPLIHGQSLSVSIAACVTNERYVGLTP